ncbi:MAG: TetR/AcrR family transcriptional regulator [Pseudomonadota bacterium]
MTLRIAPTLARNDPEQDLPAGNIKVTRADWLNLARDVLVNDGVAQIKILQLSAQLGVSRSSFYWYFENRADLLRALLAEWEARNTTTIRTECARPARNISHAVCNFFRCFVHPDLFDQGLDFAVREWARRDGAVRAQIDAADAARLQALTDMYAAHGFSDYDADARARVVYFMQLGYHALVLREPIETRISRITGYLRAFTGQEPDAETLVEFAQFARTAAAQP